MSQEKQHLPILLFLTVCTMLTQTPMRHNPKYVIWGPFFFGQRGSVLKTIVQEEQDHDSVSHLSTCTHAKKVNSELQLTVLQTADSVCVRVCVGGATVVLMLSRCRSAAHSSFFKVSHTRRARRQINCLLERIYNFAARQATCPSFGSSFSSFLNTFLEQILLSPVQIFFLRRPRTAERDVENSTSLPAESSTSKHWSNPKQLLSKVLPMKRVEICHRAIPTCAGIRWRQMSSGNSRHIVPRANTQSKRCRSRSVGGVALSPPGRVTR